MNTALLPSIAARITTLFVAPPSTPAPVAADLSDPAECPDMMGTVCKTHGCARFLDEVPLVQRGCPASPQSGAKVRFFPNSWATVATSKAPGTSRRSRMVVVRYCPECRDAARDWLNG